MSDDKVSLDELFTPTKMPRTWWSPTDGLVQDVPTALYVHVASGEPMVSVPEDAVELRPIREAPPAPEGEASRCASCEHGREHHASDTGECWYSVTRGRPDVAIACACAAWTPAPAGPAQAENAGGDPR